MNDVRFVFSPGVHWLVGEKDHIFANVAAPMGPWQHPCKPEARTHANPSFEPTYTRTPHHTIIITDTRMGWTTLKRTPKQREGFSKDGENKPRTINERQ